ncbi:MAG: thioredoxin family protein [Candidatus Eisenbacteria sp.]|nr:thioredoxin family protein [Candidatus Eisenbacteria bacterium]
MPAGFPPPEARAYLSHEALPTGGSGTLLVTLEVAPAFHIQINDFLELLLPPEAPISIGPWMATRLETWDHEQVLKGQTALKALFSVRDTAATGPLQLTLSVGYQGCAEEPVFACFPPEEIQLPLTIEILPGGEEGRPANQAILAAHGGPIGEAATAGTPPGTGGGEGASATVEGDSGGDLASRLEGALARGSILAFLLVFVGGILTSFTPCVYPMIPITISYVGGRAKSRAHGFTLSLFFVLGIALMYSTLGLLAASTGSIFGVAMQSPIVLLIVVAVFVAMGASMLGAFELALPSGMQGKMTAGAQRGGIIGAILMGMVTGLVASPCVGPVLVVLLTFVAKTGSLLFGFWLLFTFACGLGMLFLVLGTFAGAISAMPGAGGWMNTVKHVFGIALIAMAIFYLGKVIGPLATGLVWGHFLVLAGVLTGAFKRIPHPGGVARALGKLIGLLLFVAGTLILLLYGATLLGLPAEKLGPIPIIGNPALQESGRHAGHPEIPWRINDEAALQEAREQGRPAIQDFYADWCAACVELDEKTWVDAAVISEMKRFELVKMDFTRGGESYQAAAQRYGIRGLPTVIFYDASGQEATRFFGFKGPEEVLEIMRAVK